MMDVKWCACFVTLCLLLDFGSVIFGSVTESCDSRHDDHGDPAYGFSREYIHLGLKNQTHPSPGYNRNG